MPLSIQAPARTALIYLSALAFDGSLCAVSAAPETDVFSQLAGRWSGGGSVVSNSGTEKIRSRVTYAVSPSGSGLNQKLRCPSASFRFDIASNVVESGGRISGQWTESTRNIVGSMSGTIRGGQIESQVMANGFSALLNIRTNKNRQTVVFHPRDYEVSEVSITLTRE